MMREEEDEKKNEITFLVCVFFMRTRLMLMRLESTQGKGRHICSMLCKKEHSSNFVNKLIVLKAILIK